MNSAMRFEEGWDNGIKVRAVDVLENSLDSGISSINGALFTYEEYSFLYTMCYDMCEQKGANELSSRLYLTHAETIQSYLQRQVLPAIERAVTFSDPDQLLEEIKTRWDNHTIMNKWYARFFSHLDRTYAKPRRLPTLTQQSFTIFKNHLYDKIKIRAKDAVLVVIAKEREGEIIKKSLIRNTVKLYEAMGIDRLDIYESDLESAFLAASQEYYSQKRREWIDIDSTPEYLIKVEQSLAKERNRVNEYLNPKTDPKILDIVDEEMITNAYPLLIVNEGSGCAVLLANDKIEDLKRMFRLFKRIGTEALMNMSNVFKIHVQSQGEELLNQRQTRIDDEWKGKDRIHDKVFVDSLLELHQKYLDLLQTEFECHSLFDAALKDAFKKFINEKGGSTNNVELLSSYCDVLIKKEKLNDQELEEKLERIVQLFLYLNEKDRFVEIYRNQLAKRLLSHGSSRIDIEKIMISKLKAHCGTEFTKKLEGMLTDFELGSDLKSEFNTRADKENFKQKNIDFGVQILTNGYWPTYETPDVTIPKDITSNIDSFSLWFKKKHQQRNLNWIHSIGTATVKAVYGRKTYDLEVTALQAIVLNALNSGKKSYTELKGELNLEDNILKPVMHSLCCGQKKVVLKAPNNQKIDNRDKFTANSKFSSNSRKVRIPMPDLAKKNKSSGNIEISRKHMIEAAIVRIMKARKTMNHQQLVAEVLSQLAFFKPTSRDIKKRIGNLIELGYIERSQENENIFNYLA